MSPQHARPRLRLRPAASPRARCTARFAANRYAPGVQPQDPHEHLKDLDTRLAGIEQVLDLPAMRREAADLERQAADPGLWNDPENAQRVTSRLSFLQAEIRRVEGLRKRWTT